MRTVQQGFIEVAGRCAEYLFAQIYNHSSKTIPLQHPVEPTYESLPLASSNEMKEIPIFNAPSWQNTTLVYEPIGCEIGLNRTWGDVVIAQAQQIWMSQFNSVNYRLEANVTLSGPEIILSSDCAEKCLSSIYKSKCNGFMFNPRRLICELQLVPDPFTWKDMHTDQYLSEHKQAYKVNIMNRFNGIGTIFREPNDTTGLVPESQMTAERCALKCLPGPLLTDCLGFDLCPGPTCYLLTDPGKITEETVYPQSEENSTACKRYTHDVSKGFKTPITLNEMSLDGLLVYEKMGLTECASRCLQEFPNDCIGFMLCPHAEKEDFSEDCVVVRLSNKLVYGRGHGDKRCDYFECKANSSFIL
ncbi:unnamed protein product [Protopolystoma xenopodis]|uniref:Apple domain-containing protein n=1 Tax=Protopolystoma xenopodis TaxID=117903 RepID=A0A3S5AC78_9PLAT|nr:unnamed protein product [Protopolystoma xenopodis]